MVQRRNLGPRPHRIPSNNSKSPKPSVAQLPGLPRVSESVETMEASDPKNLQLYARNLSL